MLNGIMENVAQKRYGDTLQGTNISHLGKSKIIFKRASVGDMLVDFH